VTKGSNDLSCRDAPPTNLFGHGHLLERPRSQKETVSEEATEQTSMSITADDETVIFSFLGAEDTAPMSSAATGVDSSFLEDHSQALDSPLLEPFTKTRVQKDPGSALTNPVEGLLCNSFRHPNRSPAWLL
jgi:hypothetical protein